MAGKRIDDHSFFAGKGEKGVVLPKGVHLKAEHDDGAKEHLHKYEDTTEAILAQQELGERQAKKHDQRPMHRY